MIRKIIVFFCFAFLLSVQVFAENTPEAFYKEQADLSGADSLPDALPDSAADILGGVNPEDSEYILSLTPKNVFSHIWEFLKSGAKTPFVASAIILGVILISAAISSNCENESVGGAASFATAAAAAAAICVPVFSTLSAAANALKGCSVFMMSFIPVFTVVVSASGHAATAVAANALLLGAAQVVSFASSFVVLPLISGCLTISISSSVSPLLQKSGLASGIKSLSLWIMSLVTTVFIGILSIQTAVAASADTLTVKTAKFVIGSTVPIAGSALAEALTTVTASMGTLKATIGIYGVIACLVIFLPLLAELFIWRVCLALCGAVSDLFSVGKVSVLLKSVADAVSVLIGVLLLTAALFVISLSIIVSVGK